MAGFDITAAEGSDSVCYGLLPEGTMSDMVKWAEKASPRFNTNIVLVSGMDWNRDMTPWSAAGVMKEKNAPKFHRALEFLLAESGESVSAEG